MSATYKCDKCANGRIILRLGEYGLFCSCNNYPNCNNKVKLHDYIYNVLKIEGIEIYGWKRICWKCQKETMVYTYFINMQLNKYFERGLSLATIGLGSVKSVDDFLIKRIKTINNNFSKAKNHVIASNNCAHCNALQGNNYVVDDPHEIFHDFMSSNLCNYKVATISVDDCKIIPEEFKGLEHHFSQG